MTFVRSIIHGSAVALGRRALDAKPPKDDIKVDLSTGAVISLVATVLVYFVVSAAISYVSNVVTTLMMVESPPPPYSLDVARDPLLADPDNKDPNDPEQAFAVHASQQAKPFTHNIRSTLKHLRSQCGAFAGLRGLRMAVVGSVVTGLFTLLLSIPTALVRPILGSSISNFLLVAGACALSWQFSTAWVHIVISRPSSKSLFSRLPPRTFWRGVAPAAALVGLATSISLQVPSMILTRFAIPLVGDGSSKKELAKLGNIAFACFVLSVLLQFMVVVPSSIALTRIQASTLPAEDEPIVPFDHTYGGHVISVEDGGSGVVSFKDAWSSFSWRRTVHIMWTLFKFALIETALTVVFFVALVAQLIYFIPDDARGKIVNKMQDLVKRS